MTHYKCVVFCEFICRGPDLCLYFYLAVFWTDASGLQPLGGGCSAQPPADYSVMGYKVTSPFSVSRSLSVCRHGYSRLSSPLPAGLFAEVWVRLFVERTTTMKHSERHWVTALFPFTHSLIHSLAHSTTSALSLTHTRIVCSQAATDKSCIVYCT